MMPTTNRDIKEYLISCVENGLLGMIFYRKIIFRCLDHFSYTESKIILWVMLAVSILLCGIFAFRCYQTNWNAEIAVILPYGCYTVLAYREIIGTRITVILGISIVAVTVYTALSFRRKIRNRKRKKEIFIRRCCRCIYAAQLCITVGMVVIMAPMIINGVFGTSLFKPQVKATTVYEPREQMVDHNIETLILLQPERWEMLSIEEKLDVLQTVANIEAGYLGLPNELNVRAANLTEPTQGRYEDNSYTINIDLEHLQNNESWEVLETCCHEAFHGYEYRLVDAYDSSDERMKNLRVFEPAITYSEEFNNYVTGNNADTWEDYYEQRCESDARSYAETMAENYYSEIYGYLDTHSD